jgi:hypothetical protein
LRSLLAGEMLAVSVGSFAAFGGGAEAVLAGLRLVNRRLAGGGGDAGGLASTVADGSVGAAAVGAGRTISIVRRASSMSITLAEPRLGLLGPCCLPLPFVRTTSLARVSHGLRWSCRVFGIVECCHGNIAASRRHAAKPRLLCLII